MNFRTQFEKCEDCGAKPKTEPLAYEVTETKRLCEGCAEKRASMVCDKDVPAEGACCLPEKKSEPTFNCSHRTVGMCHTCEEFVRKQLEKLQLRPQPRDIQHKKLRQRKEIELPNSIKFPRICCSNGDDELFIMDSDSGCLFRLDLDTGEVVKIVSASPEVGVSDCKMVNSRELVLGNMATGCLDLCSQSGKRLDIITLPHRKSMKEVCVGTSTSGLIFAAKVGESKIFVMNSQTRKYVRTIRLDGTMTVLRGIQATASGKLVVQTGWVDFTVIDRSGQQETITEGSWFQATCCVHPTRDLLYVFYSRNGGDTETIHVDEVTTTGELMRRNILSFKISGALSLPIITQRMELMVCDGRSINVYE